MTTQYSPLLGLALPVTGELSGTWGDVVNDSITSLVEDSVAGFATADVTSSNWTLTTTGSGAANQARMMILRPTGNPGVSRNIVAPSSSKIYVVINTSDDVVVLKGSATTGVEIQSYVAAVCAWDGTDFTVVSDVTGPASATDTAIATFDGSTGKIIKNNTNATISGSVITATGFAGPLTGNVTGNVTGNLTGNVSSSTITTATIVNPTITGYVESVVAIGTVGSSSTISLTSGTVQTATLTASTTCTFTMPTATAGKSFILILKQAASTGNGDATFTGVKWPQNIAPIITATAGKLDIITFVADGSYWYGSIVQGYTA